MEIHAYLSTREPGNPAVPGGPGGPKGNEKNISRSLK